MGVPVLARGLAPRTAELLGVLSACLDGAEGRAEGHAVRVAYLASRIAAELGMGDDARCHLLYAGLLHDAGSTGPAAPGDGTSAGRPRRRPILRRAPSPGPEIPAGADPSRPDRAAALVGLLGLPQGVLEAVVSGDERWDGRGPRRERRHASPPGARVVALAAAAAGAAAPPGGTAASPGGTAASIERVLRGERGRALDPELVDAAIALGRKGLWGEIASVPLLERMLDLEPPHRVRHTDEAGLDRTAGAFADLVDTRTPFAGRHGRRVADLAARTAAALGVEPRVASDIRRAALLHDIGRLVVPVAILEKPDVLSPDERRIVDEHARTGAAVLERSRALGPLAPLVAAHHERLDGTGSFPALVDDDRELGARIIALSDRFEAMTADRPWRPALTPAAAWQALRDEATEPLAGVVLRIMERTVGDG